MIQYKREAHLTAAAIVPTAAMFFGQFAAAFPLRVLPILAPMALIHDDIQESSIGYFSTMAAIGACASSLITSRLVNRLGAPRTLQLAMLIAIVASLLLAVPHFWLMILGSFLAGMADGPTPSAGSAELQESSPPRLRNTLFSIKMLGGALGGMTAGLAYPVLSLFFGWTIGPMLAGIVACCAWAFILLTEKYWPKMPKRTAVGPQLLCSIFQPLKNLAQFPYALRLAWAGVILAISQGVWYSFYVTFLVRELGHSVVFSGGMVSISLACVVASRLILARIADAKGNGQKIFSVLCIFGAMPWAALAIATPETSEVLIVILSLLFGTTLGGWIGLQHAELVRTTPRTYVTDVVSAATLLMFSGLTISGVGFSSLIELMGGYRFGFLCIAAVTFLLGGFLLVRPIDVKTYF